MKSGQPPKLSYASSPLQMSLGDSQAQYYLGLVVGNFILVASLLLVGQLIGHASRRYILKDEENWSKVGFVFATSHISLVLFFICALLLAPTLSATLIVLKGTETDEVGGEMYALVIMISLILLGVGFFFIFWSTFFRNPQPEGFKKVVVANNNTDPNNKNNNNNNNQQPMLSNNNNDSEEEEEDQETDESDDRHSTIPTASSSSNHKNNTKNNHTDNMSDNNNTTRANMTKQRPEEPGAFSRFFTYWFRAEGAWTVPKKFSKTLVLVRRDQPEPAGSSSRTFPSSQSPSIRNEKEQETNKKIMTHFLIAEPCFESLRDTKWFVVADLVSSVCCAFPPFFAQFASDGRTACIVEGVLLAINLIVFTGILLWKNPFKIRCVRWFAPFTAIQQVVLTVATLVSVAMLKNTTETSTIDTSSMSWLLDVMLVPVISEAVSGLLAMIAAFSPVLKFVKRLVARISRLSAVNSNGTGNNNINNISHAAALAAGASSVNRRRTSNCPPHQKRKESANTHHRSSTKRNLADFDEEMKSYHRFDDRSRTRNKKGEDVYDDEIDRYLLRPSASSSSRRQTRNNDDGDLLLLSPRRSTRESMTTRRDDTRRRPTDEREKAKRHVASSSSRSPRSNHHPSRQRDDNYSELINHRHSSSSRRSRELPSSFSSSKERHQHHQHHDDRKGRPEHHHHRHRENNHHHSERNKDHDNDNYNKHHHRNHVSPSSNDRNIIRPSSSFSSSSKKGRNETRPTNHHSERDRVEDSKIKENENNVKNKHSNDHRRRHHHML